MKRCRFTKEQIIKILQEHEAWAESARSLPQARYE